MVFTSAPDRALLIGLVAVVLELAAATHFRGAIIQWRPVDPVNFDGRVSMYTRQMIIIVGVSPSEIIEYGRAASFRRVHSSSEAAQTQRNSAFS